MGKKQKNKQHRKKKDSKKKKENFKKQNKQQKITNVQEKEEKEIQECRKMQEVIKAKELLNLSEFHKDKLKKLIGSLLEYNEEAKQMPKIFRMLDKMYEVDTTDIEDNFVKEKVESIFNLLQGALDFYEDSAQENQGHFVWKKKQNTGALNLEQLINEYIKELSGQNQSNNQEIEMNYEEDKKQSFTQKQNYQQKSLLEQHQAKTGRKIGNNVQSYLVGHNNLKNKFITQDQDQFSQLNFQNIQQSQNHINNHSHFLFFQLYISIFLGYFKYRKCLK